MKKLSTALKALVVVAVVAFSAQAATYPNLGFKGGPAFNSTSTAGSSSTTKFNVGGFADYEFAEYINGQLELNYWSLGDGGTGSTLAYLAVPVLFKTKFNTGTGFRPFLNAGPEIDFKISGPSTGLKSINFGLTFGGGCEYWFTPKIAALLDLRYMLGLTNTIDTGASPLLAGAEQKLRSFQVNAGMSFAL